MSMVSVYIVYTYVFYTLGKCIVYINTFMYIEENNKKKPFDAIKIFYIIFPDHLSAKQNN